MKEKVLTKSEHYHKVNKITSILLACILSLSLFACGQKINNKNAWTIQQTTDEFGDITNNSQNVMTASFSGTFGNTATNNGDLIVDVSFTKKQIIIII